MFPHELGHEDIFIYDTDKFIEIHAIRQPYKDTKEENLSRNSMMSLLLEEKSSGKKVQFFQSHIPGGSEKRALPARK